MNWLSQWLIRSSFNSLRIGRVGLLETKENKNNQGQRIEVGDIGERSAWKNAEERSDEQRGRTGTEDVTIASCKIKIIVGGQKSGKKARGYKAQEGTPHQRRSIQTVGWVCDVISQVLLYGTRARALAHVFSSFSFAYRLLFCKVITSVYHEMRFEMSNIGRWRRSLSTRLQIATCIVRQEETLWIFSLF